MDVVELPQGDCPVPVCFDKHASEADATIVIGRIKPHTDFHGKYESGLMKMITIGLGKRRGAEIMHNAVNKKEGVYGMLEYIPRIALQALKVGNIVAGMGAECNLLLRRFVSSLLNLRCLPTSNAAIVENAYDETKLIKAVPAAAIPDEEPALLDIARASMPRLPVQVLQH